MPAVRLLCGKPLHLHPERTSPYFFILLILYQFPVTEGARLPFLNENFSHHLDQFSIFQNLLHNMWMGSPVKFAVRKTTFSAHLFAPQSDIKRLLKKWKLQQLRDETPF
jgi:hypothetical protein